MRFAWGYYDSDTNTVIIPGVHLTPWEPHQVAISHKDQLGLTNKIYKLLNLTPRRRDKPFLVIFRK